MTIGPITPAATLLAGRVQGGPDVPDAPATGALFTNLLDAEIQAAGEQVAGAAAGDGPRTGAAATMWSPAATPPTTAAQAAVIATPPTTAAQAVVTTAPAATPPTAAAHHAAQGFMVSYVHGDPPVSRGLSPAPLVNGATGALVLTAKTTGLTQLTTRFTGTVAAPTAAARATAAVMSQIARLVADGQA